MPLAPLENLVFRGGKHIEAVSDALRAVRPMPAAFDRKLVLPRRSWLNVGHAVRWALSTHLNGMRGRGQLDRIFIPYGV